jgi:hypothetical protein
LSVEDMVSFPGLSVCPRPWASEGRSSHPLPDTPEGTQGKFRELPGTIEGTCRLELHSDAFANELQ